MNTKEKLAMIKKVLGNNIGRKVSLTIRRSKEAVSYTHLKQRCEMKIYNTLTRKKEDFKPINPNKALIYVCGPTVYNYIHIGNARPMIVYDTLRRYLLYLGYDVKFVSNFTDIDDKIINKAREENIAFTDVTKKYIDAYLEDSIALNLFESHTIHPRATECIEDMIERCV